MRKVSNHVNHIFIRLHRINECGRQKKKCNQNLSSTQTLNSSGAFIVTSTSFFTRYRFGFKIYSINLMFFFLPYFTVFVLDLSRIHVFPFTFFSSIDFKSMLFSIGMFVQLNFQNLISFMRKLRKKTKINDLRKF